jgi:hypothetical protein
VVGGINPVAFILTLSSDKVRLVGFSSKAIPVQSPGRNIRVQHHSSVSWSEIVRDHHLPGCNHSLLGGFDPFRNAA